MKINPGTKIIDTCGALVAGLLLTGAAISLLVIVALHVNAAPWQNTAGISTLALALLAVLLTAGIAMLRVFKTRRAMAFVAPVAWWLMAPFVLPLVSSVALVDGFAAVAATQAYASFAARDAGFCRQAGQLADAVYSVPLNSTGANGMSPLQVNARWAVNGSMRGFGVLPQTIQPFELLLEDGEANGCGKPHDYWVGAGRAIMENALENRKTEEKSEAFAAAMHLNVPGVLKSALE